MANKFDILITATDKASAVFARVDKEATALTRPLREGGEALAKFAEGSGLTIVADRLKEVGKGALEVGRGLRETIEPLAKLAGIGATLSLGESLFKFAEAGGHLTRLSEATGVSASRLNDLENAARLAGGSADDMSNAIDALGKKQRDAVFGGDIEGRQLFNFGGIKIGDRRGLRDTEAVLRDVAKWVKKLQGRPTAQRELLARFGIPENLLPLLRDGAEGLDQLMGRAHELGGLTDEQIEAGERAEQQWTALRIAGDKLAEVIGGKLTPRLEPLIEKLTRVIAVDGGRYFDEFADKADRAAQAVGGWQVVALGIGAGFAAGPIKNILELAGSIVSVGVAMGAMTFRLSTLALVGLAPLALKAGLAAESLGAGGLASALTEVGSALEAAPFTALGAAAAAIGSVGYAAWDLVRGWRDEIKLLAGDLSSVAGNAEDAKRRIMQQENRQGFAASMGLPAYAGMRIGTAIGGALHDWFTGGGTASPSTGDAASGPYSGASNAVDSAAAAASDAGGTPGDQDVGSGSSAAGSVQVDVRFVNPPGGMQYQARAQGSVRATVKTVGTMMGAVDP